MNFLRICEIGSHEIPLPAGEGMYLFKNADWMELY
jgi:hypothetical protein